MQQLTLYLKISLPLSYHWTPRGRKRPSNSISLDPGDPPNPFPVIYPTMMCTYVHERIYTRMFIAAPLIIATETGNNPNVHKQ